ncbi:hypothetical protein BC937DRAFT_95009 [Endogone sp. FLAS-F59071]|nr:hypothetical protein BC937DRAFT_95009 [Endogone sp. FLAS-F59071]|eukprot:RUS13640.1 hypothetical protein BC937DRAFT_95009 [Endogone sp. FLAS-F59071]
MKLLYLILLLCLFLSSALAVIPANEDDFSALSDKSKGKKSSGDGIFGSVKPRKGRKSSESGSSKGRKSSESGSSKGGKANESKPVKCQTGTIKCQKPGSGKVGSFSNHPFCDDPNYHEGGLAKPCKPCGTHAEIVEKCNQKVHACANSCTVYTSSHDYLPHIAIS